MPKTAYEDTSIPVERSKAQIEKMLKGYGVKAVRFTSYAGSAELAFIRQNGEVLIPYKIVIKPKRRPLARHRASELDRAERQVWRVVYWWLKAKLEAIAFGLVEFEQELLPYMLIADRGQDKTVSEVVFKRLAGMVSTDDDPFGGLALPSAQPELKDGGLEND